MHSRVISTLIFLQQAASLSSAVRIPHLQSPSSHSLAKRSFVHPGALHTADDISRVVSYVEAETQPWYRSFQHLESSAFADSSREPQAHEVIYRGDDGEHSENYADAFEDAAAAYQLALRWSISGDSAYADTAVSILDAWASTLTEINGTSDLFLAAGLYGYQFANAGELLRSYDGWSADSQSAFGDMLLGVFAPLNRVFLDEHNGNPDHYYANWDLCNIAAYMAIGIFTDNQTMYDYSVDYFVNGPADGAVSNGALPFFGIANFTEDDTGKVLTQGQEAGRDQGHSLLDVVLLGVIGQQAYNQGDDLFATFANEILNAAEYIAKYNVNETVPYEAYEAADGNLTEISSDARADVRPGYEIIYSHYSDLKGLDASWSGEFRDYVNSNLDDDIEGGGGDYGTTSGGFDALGYGTLMYRLTADE